MLERRRRDLFMSTTNISEENIKQLLEIELQDKIRFQIYETIDSTNTKLKVLAAEGLPEWTVLLAAEQTNGRGRMNRSFFSPEGTGIYMSILLRPDVMPEAAGMLTVLAAVAVTDAISKVYGIETEIKWVNDVYYQKKKVCGILAEAALKPDYKTLDYVVLGIGINVEMPKTGFPAELESIATSLEKNPDSNPNINAFTLKQQKSDRRYELIAAVLQQVNKYYERILKGEKTEIMERYRERSFLIGKTVVVVGNETECLQVMGIGENGELLVEDVQGNRRLLSSGEVSVKEWK